MASLTHDHRQTSLPYILYGAFACLNVLLNLLLPANSATMATYHLSRAEYHILIFLVEVPLAVIWYAAFYGYKRLHEYSELIKNSAEGIGFRRIANGLAWLAWGSPASSILSVLLYTVAHHHIGLYKAAVIIEHYISALIAVVALTNVASGTHKLNERDHRLSAAHVRMIMVLFTAFGVFYSYYTFRQVTGNGMNPYFMPLWLILLTLVIPYLYAWYMGLFAAYEMLIYRQKAKGLFYKQALSYIASGIAMIIATSVAIALLTSSSRSLTRLQLNAVLLIVYLFLILYAVGFILVVLGTKRLQKIEQV